MSPSLQLADQLVEIYICFIVVNAIFRWIIAFDLVDTDNKFFLASWYLVSRLTEPILKPLRRFAPNIGVIDISHVIVILSLLLARELLYWFQPAFSYQ